MKSRAKAALKARKKARKHVPANAARKLNATLRTLSDSVSTSNDPQTPSCSQQNTASSVENKKGKVFQPLRNKSAEKLTNSFLKSVANKQMMTRSKMSKVLRTPTNQNKAQAAGNSIINMSILEEVIKNTAICGKCKHPNSKLTLKEHVSRRYGLAQKFSLDCNICYNSTEFSSSAKDGQQHNINKKSVHASCQGMGLSGLKKMTAILDLPPPVTDKAYNTTLKNISAAAVGESEKVMTDAANRLRILVQEKTPENIVMVNGQEVTKVAVTVDGTWQRRGHKSKIGVVFLISVDTGEILDAIVKSLFCTECSKHDTSIPGYNAWYEAHKLNCEINHTGSSASMETKGAMEMFRRSIENRQLMYNVFVGDGDSDCFGSVKEACDELNIGYDVEKEECVGHIQKRLGSALREYKRRKRGIKLADGKSVGGRNRLTDYQIDRMQNFFGEAIRNNTGDLEGMRSSIFAILNHMVKNDNIRLDEQHDKCPRTMWCKYWTNRNNYNENNRLPFVFYSELKPIFTRLSNESLLKRCLRGLTQNQNEAANGVLWSKCPKRKFCGLTKVKLAVAETVLEFNTGSSAIASINSFDYSRNAMSTFGKIERSRINDAARKITEKARLIRRKARAKKQNKSESKTTTYIPGGFGVQKAPEIDFILAGINDTNLSAPVIPTFIDDKDVSRILLISHSKYSLKH